MIAFTNLTGMDADLPEDPILNLALDEDSDQANSFATEMARIEELDDLKDRERASEHLILSFAILTANRLCLLFRTLRPNKEIPAWMMVVRQAQSMEELIGRNDPHITRFVNAARKQFGLPPITRHSAA